MMQLHYIPLKQLSLKNKTVLLRIDGNVPYKKNNILDDFKLEQVKPTIDYILEQNTQVIILTHLGNPKEPSADYSTKIILPWFLKHYKKVHFIENLEELKNIPKISGELILFENVRFFKDESAYAKASADRGKNIDFAKKIAQCGEIFINDAFGTIHRDDTTIALLPTLFDYQHRSIGFLIEKELKQCEKIWEKRPILLIVGGGKPESKMKFIVQSEEHVNTILLCPLISTVINNQQKHCILPTDYMIERTIDNKKIMLEIPAEQLLETDMCISIGHATLALFDTYIRDAGTIIWNGYMGFLERDETLFASQHIAQSISKSSAFTIIAGSDTGYFARKIIKMHGKNIVFSTGGGSVLAYISQQKLPGLEPFMKTN